MLVAIKKYKFHTIKTEFCRFIIKLRKLSVGIHALINMHKYYCIVIHMRCWLIDDSLLLMIDSSLM